MPPSSKPHQSLLDAIERGDADAVHSLLKATDVASSPDVSRSLIAAACLSRSYLILTSLIDHGVFVFLASLSEARNRHVVSQFMNLAVQGGNVSIVACIGRLTGINVADCYEELKLPDGRKELLTPLLVASIHGDVPMINYLLEANVDVNRGATRDGNSPLCMATAHGHHAAVEILLEAGANPDHRNSKGETAYDMARAYGHLNILCLLGMDDQHGHMHVNGRAIESTIQRIRRSKAHTSFAVREREKVDFSSLHKKISSLKGRISGQNGRLSAVHSSSSTSSDPAASTP
ncbi:hypothetical protein SDRG_14512 [Saprolegnia diclina VS20]|uniref:Uncharacterized protein n=1 Tax=Saprolegnia diclina (strain VS20) TaxID=1156394 RepID=T0R6S7_SAPDV|nr:hypothetical protein SDRG_14512 [Saprolegnia diclina VS20]EQC27763.1 hypothetical protein SDRG_14512 [Saprolegnia diclina VS20]|eukprot:XP_008618868.1 hypothetical protein SDRG_14512 [Saprolegnia diclina VS20]